MDFRALPTLLVFGCGAATPTEVLTPDPTRVEVAPGEVSFMRMYDANGGGAPIATLDVSDAIVPPTMNAEVAAADEADIEAAARVGDVAFWITSHGRRKDGRASPARLRFFATTTPPGDEPMRVLGTTDRLLAAMIAEPKFAHLGLAKAASLSPTEPGGLNIEGMARRAEGGVWIAFRSPVIDGQALIIGLENPLALIRDAPAKFVDPLMLSLDGRGVRAMVLHRGRYAIVAGDPVHARRSVLHVWDGTRKAPRPIDAVDLLQFNAEAFVAREDRDRIMLLSDDGSVMIDGKECKRLTDPAMKQFHGRWVSLPK